MIAVDPGDAHAVKTVLTGSGLQLAGILITHHHADHTGGVVELINSFAVPVYAPVTESIPGNPIKVAEGSLFSFDDLALEFAVLNVPGHTAGHIAYVGHDSLFCGDTLFSGGCGRLLGGTAAQLYHSLCVLAALPPHTQVYCTHEYTVQNLMFAQAVEPDNFAITTYLQQCRQWRNQGRPTLPSTIGVELNINPFLRVTHASVKHSAELNAGRLLNTNVEVFAALREWKNHY